MFKHCYWGEMPFLRCLIDYWNWDLNNFCTCVLNDEISSFVSELAAYRSTTRHSIVLAMWKRSSEQIMTVITYESRWLAAQEGQAMTRSLLLMDNKRLSSASQETRTPQQLLLCTVMAVGRSLCMGSTHDTGCYHDNRLSGPGYAERRHNWGCYPSYWRCQYSLFT